MKKVFCCSFIVLFLALTGCRGYVPSLAGDVDKTDIEIMADGTLKVLDKPLPIAELADWMRYSDTGTDERILVRIHADRSDLTMKRAIADVSAQFMMAGFKSFSFLSVRKASSYVLEDQPTKLEPETVQESGKTAVKPAQMRQSKHNRTLKKTTKK